MEAPRCEDAMEVSRCEDAKGASCCEDPMEASRCEYAGILGDSEDSEEEPIVEDQLSVSWDDRPILERLGLRSGVDMTEEEVEAAVAVLALGFRCDQYTLSPRLQAEEHHRTVAMENLEMELQRSRDTLQALRGRCGDSERSDMLSRMEASLDTVLGSMEAIITAAERLGAAHQEARVSCSVELMRLHVAHLRRRHAEDSAELLEARKQLHRHRGRLLSDSAVDGDIKHLLIRQGSQQHLRRRVSVTLLPTPVQTSDLEVKFQEACRTGADADRQEPEEGAVPPAARQPDHALPARRGSYAYGQDDDAHSICSPSSLLRHRWRAGIPPSVEVTSSDPGSEVTGSEVTASEVTTSEVTGSESGSGLLEANEITRAESDYTTEPSVITSEQRPLVYWLSLLRRILLVLVLGLLCFLLVLATLLWGLRSTPHWTHRHT